MTYLRKGRPKQNGENNHNYKHGGKGTRMYRIWKELISRCNDKSNKNYGGRGISVCDYWKNFINFREWSNTNGYSDELSIDRINVDGNYSPDNCRWATSIIQNNNTRRNVYYDIKGEKLTSAQIAVKYGINKQTLQSRIHKLKWDLDKAINYGKYKIIIPTDS